MVANHGLRTLVGMPKDEMPAPHQSYGNTLMIGMVFEPELPFVGGIHWATALNHSSQMFKDLRSKMLEELGRNDFAPKTVQLRWYAYRAYTAADKVPSILEIKHVLANRTILESYLDNCSSLFTNPAQLHVLRSL